MHFLRLFCSWIMMLYSWFGCFLQKLFFLTFFCHCVKMIGENWKKEKKAQNIWNTQYSKVVTSVSIYFHKMHSSEGVTSVVWILSDNFFYPFIHSSSLLSLSLQREWMLVFNCTLVGCVYFSYGLLYFLFCFLLSFSYSFFVRIVSFFKKYIFFYILITSLYYT